MNCISGMIARNNQGGRRFVLLVCLSWCAACGSPAPSAPSDPLQYEVLYRIVPDAAAGRIDVTLTLKQPSNLLRELRMRPDPRAMGFAGDGSLDVEDGTVRWRPRASGGSLSWQVQVANRRNGDGFDAWLDTDWGLFRTEDIIPRAATRTLKGAHSDTSFTFELPRGWSVVTQYYNDNGRFRVDNPARRFDLPTGWIAMGDLGTRRETISGMRVAVTGPVGHGVRRMDTLALLNWIVPELARIVPELPRRLMIVSAGDPMWRGGLSAPQSLFMHADRPLISENATSTLLHEVMHIALSMSAADGYDWIIEGLAEHYSLELLSRSGTISASRRAQANEDLAAWSESAKTLCGPDSRGATTALAVGVFVALDREIRGLSAGQASLDDVVRELWQRPSRITLEELTRTAETLAGAKLDTLHIDALPGCRTIDADER